jgi:uncharacterized lipoprotein YmbA
MIEQMHRSIHILSLVLLLFWLVGCATPSPPSRFYRMESSSAPTGMPQPGISTQSLPLIGIGPVQLASYLDRPQMVERSTPYRLKLHEFDRWAGTLQENIVQVLNEVIQRELEMAQVVAYPWHSSVRPGYEVVLRINRFERQVDRLRLQARWILIVQPQGQLVGLDQQLFEAPIEDNDMEAVVAAASAALEQLGHAIAEDLAPLQAGQR